MHQKTSSLKVKKLPKKCIFRILNPWCQVEGCGSILAGSYNLTSGMRRHLSSGKKYCLPDRTFVVWTLENYVCFGVRTPILDKLFDSLLSIQATSTEKQ